MTSFLVTGKNFGFKKQFILSKKAIFYCFLIVVNSCIAKKASLLKISPEVPWSTSGLTWDNFQEVFSIKDSYRDPLAKIATKIYYRFSDSVIVNKDTATIQAWIHSVMNPNRSFVKSSANRKGLLEHEQIHFDINELCARQFRKEVAERIFPFSKVKFLMYEIHQKYIAEMKELNERYDAEHRDKHFGHDYWRRDLYGQLASLEKHSNTDVVIKALIKD
jgi:hypothetical protein